MNPYDIEIEELIESYEITNKKELLKYQLIREFLKITHKMNSHEILEATNLDKSDLSRIRSLNIERFSIGKIVDLLSSLGYSAKVKVVKSQEAS